MGMWVTGANSYDPAINKALGFEAPSRLVGFLGWLAQAAARRCAEDRASLARAAHEGLDRLNRQREADLIQPP